MALMLKAKILIHEKLKHQNIVLDVVDFRFSVKIRLSILPNFLYFCTAFIELFEILFCSTSIFFILILIY